MVNALSHPRGGNSNDLILNYQGKGWYFDKLRELGLTNLVTDGMYNLSITDSNNTFLLNDMGFAWKHDPSLLVPRYFKPAEFMRALGHVHSKYPLEFGGTVAPTIAPDRNFGFTVAASDATCYWGMRSEYKPVDMKPTGDNTTDNTISGRHDSRLSLYGTDDEGVMLWGMIPWTQMADPRLRYKMRILLRIADNDTTYEKDGIGVFTGPLGTNLPPPTQIEPRRNFFTEPEEIPIESVGMYQVFKNNELPENDDYYWIETNSFSVSQDLNLAFHVYWYGNLTVYIDKITFVSEEFKRLYIPDLDTLLMDSIFTELETIYPASITDSARFQSFYFDEPFQLSAEYRKDLQAEVFSKATSNNNLEINGATGAVPGYFHHFDIKWASPTENRLKNYLLYNLYPIGATTNYTQEHVQGILNTIVNYRVYNFGDDAPYQFSGLRSAQLGAQRYNTEETDDIPLVMTLGVHSEQYVVGDDLSAYTVTRTHTRRAPTYDEIFAQGNLSLAYGAKGFMYYMVPTRANAGTVQYPSWNTFGLFDDETAVYDSSNSGPGLVQDPAENQIPNHRFSAVRDFIASTALIDSVLLKLKWKDAKGWNRTESCSVNWINSVTTALDSNITQVDATPMVETGYFEEYNTTGYNPNAKYLYVVNKRCNSNINGESSRYVAMEVNFEVFEGRNNLKFTDLKTGRIYYKATGGDVVVFLKPGDGTLFKIEPTIVVGGELVGDETVASNTTIKGNIVINSPYILTIDSGADVTIQNSANINVNNTTLRIIGASINPCILDFGTASWYGGNGIVATNAEIMIDKAVIKNAKYGIKSYNAENFIVTNTQFETCYYGILLENQSSQYAQLDNISLSQCYVRGLSANDSWITMSNFNITGCETGLWFDYCYVNEKCGDPAANLFLQNNFIGLYTSYSDLYLGEGDLYPVGAYNTFLNIDQNIEAENDAFVRVQSNYWANTSSKMINAWGGASVIDEPSFTYVPDNPLSGDGKDEELAAIKGMSNGEGTTVREKLETARHHIQSNRLNQARKLCIDILEQNGDDPLTPMALLVLRQTFTPEEISSYKEYVLNGNKATKGSIAKGMLTISAFDLMEANVAIYDSICSDYAGKFPESYALYKKSLYQFGNLYDVKGAKITRNRLESKYPESIYLKDLNSRLADSVSFHPINSVPLGLPKGISNSVTEIVNEYQLFNNYPNPFNPETVIKFSLKEKSNVTLDVYNIAGQKVAELVSGEMAKGMYEKKFNGTKLSSGVYIFRLNAQSLENGNLKYSKTMKALLLK